MRGLPERTKKELSDIHCPIHTITAYNTGLHQRQACVIGDKPSGAVQRPSTTSHLIASYYPAEEITTARQTTPRQILRHPFLSCTLSFAFWMLRPFLPNVSFTPFIHLSLQTFVLSFHHPHSATSQNTHTAFPFRKLKKFKNIQHFFFKAFFM